MHYILKSYMPTTTNPLAKKESRFRKTVKKIRDFFGRLKDRIVKKFTRKRKTTTAVPDVLHTEVPTAPTAEHIAVPEAIHHHIALPTVVPLTIPTASVTKTSSDRHSLPLFPESFKEKEKTPRGMSSHIISTPSSSSPSIKKSLSDYKSADADEYILAPSRSMQTKKFRRTIFNKKNRQSRFKINKTKPKIKKRTSRPPIQSMRNKATIPKSKLLNRTICKKNDRRNKCIIVKPTIKNFLEYIDTLQSKRLYRVKKGSTV